MTAARAWPRTDTKTRHRLAGLRILLIGVEELISRDVARSLVAEKGSVTAASREDRVLAHLQRDLGLYRTDVEAAPIDLSSASEMRLYALNLQSQDRLPHLIVCCCRGGACPMPIAAAALQPSLVLHALPQARTRLGRLVLGLNIPALAALFGPLQRHGLFDGDARPRRVEIAGRVFGLRRWETSPGRRPPRPSQGGDGRCDPRSYGGSAPLTSQGPQGRLRQDAS